MNKVELFQTTDIKDYKKILEGLVDDFGYTYYHAILSWCEIIEKDKSKLWQVYLIKYNNKTIGICGLYSLKEYDDKFWEELWLGWFGILKDFRNLGLGSQVLLELEDLADNWQCKKLYTYVDVEGKRLNFYYKNGFKRISNVKEYIETVDYSIDFKEFENMDDHILMKDLSYKRDVFYE